MEGIVLYDSTGLIHEYKEKCETIIQKGPAPLTEHEKSIIRLNLSMEIKTIEGLLEKDDQAGAIILMNQILIDSISGYYDIKRWWFTGSKHIITDLKNHDIELRFLSEKLLFLKQISAKVLEMMGGEILECEFI